MIHLRVQNQRVHLNVQDQQQHLGPGMNVNPLPVFSIGEVETLPAGSDAYATITGDPRTPELNLGIPEGDTYELTDEDKQDIAGIVEGDLNYVPAGSVGHLAWNAAILNDSGEVYIDAYGNMGTFLTPVNREIQMHIQPGDLDILMGRPGETLLSMVRYSMSTDSLDVRGQMKAYLYDGTKCEVMPSKIRFSTSGGNIDGGQIEGLEDLTVASDGSRAANKNYVDTGLSGKQPVGNYAEAAAGDSTKTALHAAGIPFGQVDNTSTSTAFTATVPGVTSLYDGLAIMLKNGVVTSAAGFTINVNGLGAYQSFNNMAEATADTTLFNINYTMLFVFDSTRNGTGGWICYRGYDANTNTIGYQIRTNSQSLPMQSVTYRYRLLFTSKDGTKFVPANNSTSTNATATRTVCQDPIDPHGPIYYYGTTASVAADSRPSAANLWQQYVCTLGYSFNRTGAALTLTSWKPVYVVCAPQTDGSAIMDSTTPFVQDLPTTEDGKIYIHLGTAVSATTVEIIMNHTVYYYKDNAIRRWVGP